MPPRKPKAASEPKTATIMTPRKRKAAAEPDDDKYVDDKIRLDNSLPSRKSQRIMEREQTPFRAKPGLSTARTGPRRKKGNKGSVQSKANQTENVAIAGPAAASQKSIRNETHPGRTKPQSKANPNENVPTAATTQRSIRNETPAGQTQPQQPKTPQNILKDVNSILSSESDHRGMQGSLHTQVRQILKELSNKLQLGFCAPGQDWHVVANMNFMSGCA